MSEERQGPRVCTDYVVDGEVKRKGCGQEIMTMTFHTKSGDEKKETVSRQRVPTFSYEGEFSFRYVPHWVTCPEQEHYLEKRIAAEKERTAQNKRGGGRGRSYGGGAGHQGSRGGAPRRAGSGEYAYD